MRAEADRPVRSCVRVNGSAAGRVRLCALVFAGAWLALAGFAGAAILPVVDSTTVPIPPQPPARPSPPPGAPNFAALRAAAAAAIETLSGAHERTAEELLGLIGTEKEIARAG